MKQLILPKAQAMGTHIIVLLDKLEEKKTEGGIITQTREGLEQATTFQRATVLSVGADVKKLVEAAPASAELADRRFGDPDTVTRNIRTGDRCLIIKGSHVPYEEDGVDFAIIREDAFVAYLPA